MMTSEEKHNLIRNLYNVLFATKSRGQDPVTVRVRNKYIVNGNPIIDSNGIRVGGEVVGTMFKDSSTGEPNVRGFDIDLQDGNKILQLRFIEQNPNKRYPDGNLKPMAIAARNGSKIMWVIDRAAKTDNFLGRTQDGVWKKSSPQAVQPTSTIAAPYIAGYTTRTPELPQNEGDVDGMMDELDEFPEIADMPEWLIEKFANEEPDDELYMDEQ